MINSYSGSQNIGITIHSLPGLISAIFYLIAIALLTYSFYQAFKSHKAGTKALLKFLFLIISLALSIAPIALAFLMDMTIFEDGGLNTTSYTQLLATAVIVIPLALSPAWLTKGDNKNTKYCIIACILLLAPFTYDALF